MILLAYLLTLFCLLFIFDWLPFNLSLLLKDTPNALLKQTLSLLLLCAVAVRWVVAGRMLGRR